LVRTFLFTAIFLFILAVHGCKESSPSFLEKKLAAKDLKEDFEYFRRILESVHPGLYQFASEKEFDRQFDSVRNLLKRDETVLDFYNRLIPLVNNIHCGHTGLFLPAAFSDSIRHLDGFFPIPLVTIDNRLIVNSTSYSIPLGAEILSINGERADKLLPKLWRYETVDGFNTLYQQEEGVWDFTMNYFLMRGPQKKFKISYRTTEEGMERTLQETVKPETYAAAADDNFTNRYYYFAEDVNYDMDIIDSIHTAIMTVYTFGYDTYSTDRAFTRFVKNSFRLLRQTPEIKNLIIDLRNNTGGNFHDMFYLYGYLTRKEEWKEFKSAFTVFNQIPYTPYLAKGENDIEGIQASIDSSFNHQRQGRSLRQYADNETKYAALHPFKGKVYVITNTNVQSAASYFAALLQDEGRARIVGSETGGSGSSTNSFHVLTYELPHSHIRLNVPVVHADFSLTGNHAGGRGVLPDYPVPLTLADLKNNTDPQLGFVLDSLIHQ
jgi:hypothetical protein